MLVWRAGSYATGTVKIKDTASAMALARWCLARTENSYLKLILFVTLVPGGCTRRG